MLPQLGIITISASSLIVISIEGKQKTIKSQQKVTKMKFNQLAGLGIASLVLFGSIGEIAPVKALEISDNNVVASNNLVLAKKVIKGKSRRHRRIRRNSRRRFIRGRRGAFRGNFRRNYNPIFINRGRSIHRNHINFNNSLSTGNTFHESHGRTRLF